MAPFAAAAANGKKMRLSAADYPINVQGICQEKWGRWNL